ncbi:5,6-dimethylbenzimidazole synthase [Paracidobacterium acidisoli]|uniref:5,6-dimethylbenzimidazole synthase n=1 Tax=Paracidobacterium acidisoli TaxID=2303751 RepID=A0A372IQL5_9BACT|nr:5,6-dimethylbenzimidazole synthase [Paracidobacterium acidisoli]MBT9331249.1 5,6-dimethylbenzimidazole synthase [Paracidobacterium acidisoli]
MQSGGAFSLSETEAVYRAIRERRDVRSGFLPDAVEEAVLLRLLRAAHCAPSVGLMQPARFIVVRSHETRSAVHQLFLEANRAAAAAYHDEQQELYRSLRLEGLLQAPLHLCVVCDETSTQGHGLGRHTMPQTSIYSTVCAIQNLWLAARAEGIGVGWVSILDPAALKNLLHVPPEMELIAWLCLGYVEQFAPLPDLERDGWEQRRPLASLLRSEFFDRPYPVTEEEL